MIGITIAVGIMSLIASISTIRRNRRESFHVRLARGALAAVSWPLAPLDVIDAVHDGFHWIHNRGNPAPQSVPVSGILPDISALNELVAHAGEILNRAEDQGFLDVRIMLPP